MTIETHRGIRTNTSRKHERIPITIINRLKQKSISLPRIDNNKQWAGYPGLTGWAKDIAKMIPDCDYYVEPFAGAAKVFQELMKRKNVSVQNVILNDKSQFIVDWLRREFDYPNLTISKVGFQRCIKKYDSKNTVFLIDSPWSRALYLQSFSYFDRSLTQYTKDILKLCRTMKGKFIVTSRKENIALLDSEFNHVWIKSIYPVSGRLPRALITTNLDLR